MTYATVHDAGHLVPTSQFPLTIPFANKTETDSLLPSIVKPKESLYMMKRFWAGEDF